MNYKEIIERLSLIRTKNNLSAREFGLMIGNSDTYFYKVEGKSIILNVPKLLEILDALQVSTEEFFYDDFENYKRDNEILSLTKNLTKDELQALILLLKRKN